MKRTGIIFFFFLVTIACSSPKITSRKMQLTTQPAKPELFVKEGTGPYTIPVNYILNIPENYIPPKGRLIYIPRFAGPDNEYFLRPVIVEGTRFREQKASLQLPGRSLPDLSGARVLRAGKGAMQVKIEQTVPFELWMPKARFVATVILQQGREYRISENILADGIVYMPLAPGPVRVKYVEKEIPVQRTSVFRILYPVNVSYLRTGLADNDSQLEQIGKLMSEILHNPAYRLDRIVITGTCSPDGSLAYNERLAGKRAGNFMHYLESGYGPFHKPVEVRTIARDWQGFEKLVRESDIPDKQSVLAVLGNRQNESRQLAEIRHLSVYPYLVGHIFPRLQQTVCEIQYTVKEIQTVPIPE